MAKRAVSVLVCLFALFFASSAGADGDVGRGRSLIARKGCLACHSTDGTPRVGPSFRRLYGSTRRVVTDGAVREVVADDAYVARSLREPDADVTQGFPRGNMPRFDVSGEELAAVNAALRDLAAPGGEAEAKAAGSMMPFALSVASFVGFHFLLSSIAVKRRLVGIVGARGFRGLYSIVALASFVGIVWFFRRAPYVEVWSPPRETRWVPLLVMPIAVVFLVLGFSTPGPTTVGQGARAKDEPRGIQAVTRHPGLWGFALWALAHLAANGELAVILLAGGILVLALGGMLHIDARRAAELGPAWASFAARTSIVPFAAIARGKATLRFADVGTARLAVAAVVYVALLLAHPFVIGASPYP